MPEEGTSFPFSKIRHGHYIRLFPDRQFHQLKVIFAWQQHLIQQSDYQATRNYLKVLKNRLNKEGSQSVTNCNRLKMEAADEKNI